MSFVYDDRWSHGGIGRFSSEVKKRLNFDFEYISTGCQLSPYDPFFLDAIVHKNKASIYFSPGFNAPFLYASRAIITIHDLMHLNFKEYANLNNKIYYNTFIKRVCKYGLAILTDSEFSKKEIVKWSKINEDKVIVVGCGVENKFTKDVEPYRPGFRYILYVGNHKSHKNIKRMIDAFLKSSLIKSCKFLISGKISSEINKYINFLNAEDVVKFTGFINETDLPSYYKGAAICLQATLYEGFGLPVLEAMACGTPVVTSDITSLPEVAGNAAELVDPYSIDSIAQGLENVYFNRKYQDILIQYGLQRAASFSWDMTANIINNVIHAHSKRNIN